MEPQGETQGSSYGSIWVYKRVIICESFAYNLYVHDMDFVPPSIVRLNHSVWITWGRWLKLGAYPPPPHPKKSQNKKGLTQEDICEIHEAMIMYVYPQLK